MVIANVIRQPNYINKRNGRFLLIWRDVPHWMVVDEEVVTFLRMLDGTKSFKEIITILCDTFESSYEKKYQEANNLLRILKKAGLVKNEEKKNTLAPISPVIENITINITNRCNFRCTHCFVSDSDRRKDLLDLEHFKQFLKEANDHLASNLNFAILGGEPLLQKEKTLEIARIGKEKKIEVIVSTNGSLVDDDFAKKAKKAGLVVQISMEGATSDINDSIRGNGSFIKAKRGVECLVSHRVYTILSMVVQKLNYHQINDFYNLGRNLRVNEIRFIQLKRMGRAREGDLEPVSNIELLNAINILKKNNPGAKKYLKRDYHTIMKTICSISNRRAYCGTGLKTLLIDSDGEVFPCPNHNLPEFACGNIKDKSFQEIWLKSPILNKVRNTYHIDKINSECPSCSVKYWCMGGCRGETYENTSNMRSKAVGCEDIRNTIIETFWMLSENKVFPIRSKNNRRTEFF